MSLVRVQTSVSVLLAHEFDVDAAPADAAGAVTVSVKRLDGTAVTSGAASQGTVGDGIYTFTLPASAVLDAYTVDWTGTFGGVAVTVRDYVEIVGGFLFSLAKAYTQKPVMSQALYPPADVAAKRIEVEDDFEGICRQAFVPRFTRERLRGTGTPRLGVAWRKLRTLRAVTVAGVAWAAPDVAAVLLSDHGVLTRPGGAIWPAGVDIWLEYEHGHDFPPPSLDTVGVLWLRHRLGMFGTNVPARATSYQAAEGGGTFRLSTPDRDHTGIPDVDAVLARYPAQRRAPIA